MGVKDLAAHSLRRTLEARGYRVTTPNFRNDSDIRRKLLMDRLGIDLVLDIGASDGMYAKWLRGAGYAGRIHSFEPLPGPYAALAEAAEDDPAWATSNLALGDVEDVMDINVSSRDTWSSLLPMDAAADAPELDYQGTEQVDVARLDALEVLDDSTSAAWLKLDVQGYEMQTLAGAQATLAACVAVECEISLEPLYQGQPSVRQMIDYLDDRGLTLAGATNGRVREETGRAVWVDGLFVRQ